MTEAFQITLDIIFVYSDRIIQLYSAIVGSYEKMACQPNGRF